MRIGYHDVARRLRLGVLIWVLAPALGLCFSAGPPEDRVHRCGNSNGCDNIACHDSPRPSSIDLQFGLEASPGALPAVGYTPDATYRFLISLVENDLSGCAHPARAGDCAPTPIPADACMLGFQITAAAWDGAGCALPDQPVGTWLPPLETGVQLNKRFSVFTFVNHTSCGIIPTVITPTTNAREWLFDWQAPAAGTSDVRFFIGANSANGHGDRAGDTPSFMAVDWVEESGVGCDLMAAESAFPVDKAALFSDASSCAPDVLPGSVLVPRFTAIPVQDVDALGGGPGLTVYEIYCPCTGTLRMVKSGDQVVADWSP